MEESKQLLSLPIMGGPFGLLFPSMIDRLMRIDELLVFSHGIHDDPHRSQLTFTSAIALSYVSAERLFFIELTINESRSPDGEARLVALRQIANFLESAGRLLPSRRFQLGKLGKLGTFVAQRARKKTKL